MGRFILYSNNTPNVIVGKCTLFASDILVIITSNNDIKHRFFLSILEF